MDNCHDCPNKVKVLTEHSKFFFCNLEEKVFPLNRSYLRKDAEKPKWCKRRIINNECNQDNIET